MTSLSPAQQLRLDLYRDRLAVDPATALDGAIAAYNWIVGQGPETVRIVEIDPASFTPRTASGEINVYLSAPEQTLPAEDVQPQADRHLQIADPPEADVIREEVAAALPPRSPWTAAQDRRLEQLLAAGLPVARIAEEMGRTKTAVQFRIHYLKLSEKYPRGPGGQLKYTPVPLDDPSSEPVIPQPKPKKNSLFNARQRALVESADPDWQKNADANTLKILLDAGKTLVDIAEIVHAPSWHVVRDLAAKHGLLARTANGRWTRPTSQSAVAEGSAPQVKERKCLRCGTSFPSEGPGNRLCGTCRDTVSGEYDPWGGK